MIEEGRVESSLFLLVEGQAVVTKRGISVARLQAPTLFGELAAIAPAPRSADVVAEGPCRAFVLPREALYSLMLDERAVVDLMLELVVERLDEPALQVDAQVESERSPGLRKDAVEIPGATLPTLADPSAGRRARVRSADTGVSIFRVENVGDAKR